MIHLCYSVESAIEVHTYIRNYTFLVPGLFYDLNGTLMYDETEEITERNISRYQLATPPLTLRRKFGFEQKMA